jgi:hypothetical protein
VVIANGGAWWEEMAGDGRRGGVHERWSFHALV